MGGQSTEPKLFFSEKNVWKGKMGKARSPLIAEEAEDGTNLGSSVIHSLRTTRALTHRLLRWQ